MLLMQLQCHAEDAEKKEEDAKSFIALPRPRFFSAPSA
jgi:hypothetical protein